ncbi:MAG TPA: polysaccharide lyase family protein [Bryocella sp.]|nr:polysaccharide lyase family protein [Bryocella sp.]
MGTQRLRSGNRLGRATAILTLGCAAFTLSAIPAHAAQNPQANFHADAPHGPHADPVTIDTTDPTDWKISNGVFNIDFNPTAGNIFSMTMASTGDQLVDTTTLNSNGQPKGFYMDNAGFGSSTPVPGYSNVPSNGFMPAYLDWWVTYPSNSKNAYTYSEHWIVTANDPGLHVYFVANHAASDIAGSIGQVQWVFRDSLTQFTNTYSVNPSVNNPGVTTVPLPPSSEMFSTDPGRNVQDATVDLHGLPVPPGFTREFYTKYDYAGYEYLHRAHGLYGTQYGIWTVLPSKESMVGGPTKQDLYFTGNLLMIEAYSNHLDNPITLNTPSGTASSRLFGPFYVRVNQFPPAHGPFGKLLANDPSLLYADALIAGNSHTEFYDHETQLLDAGYVPSYDRGSVLVHVKGVTGIGSTPTKAAWAVLSDPSKNFQFSSAGAQYWADISRDGVALFPRVIPGTYRLSVFVLGQFGELRQDNIVVNKGSFTSVPELTFAPENFGTTVFNIGTPDRSSHEFLHGHDAKGFDLKDYWGSWNYWADFEANQGSVVYNATAGPAGPATNDLNQWNYDHWGVFDPGLYDPTNDSKDNYIHTIPSYVATLPNHAGTNGVSTRTPVWTVHFATPQDAGNYTYAVLSVALACDFGSYVTNLNGTARTWGYRTAVASDCAVRSGLSGYYQWVAFQFPIASLKPAGEDNVLTLGVSQTYGAMDDALRLELTNTSAAPSVTGWNDYEFVGTSSTSQNIPANDTVPNP